jgi:uncharacterized RDD family membrane protein YckC
MVGTKQIIYPKLVTRLFCSIIDLLILAIFSTPLTQFFSKYTFLFAFRSFLIENDITSASSIAMVSQMPNFLEYINNNSGALVIYIFLCLMSQIAIIGSFFLGFWISKSATPGKLLLKLKIVDATTLGTPSKYQFFKRFAGYSTSLVGIWFIAFTARRQALHDKIAGTVVIKV